MIKAITDKVDAAGGHREYLVVSLYLQFQMLPEIFPDIDKEGMQGSFIRAQDDQVIAVSEIITDPPLLLQPTIQSSEIKIRKILAEVIAYRKAICAVDNLIEQPKKSLILKFSTKESLQDGVIYRWVEF